MPVDTDAGRDVDTARRRRGVSLATRLAAAVVGVSFAALIAATAVGVDAGIRLGRDIYENRLVSLGNAGSDDVGQTLSFVAASADALASSPATADAVRSFGDALDDLTPPPDFDLETERRRLIEEYGQIYSAELAKAADDVSLQGIVTRTASAVYLQSLYSIATDEPAATVDDAGDGSAWSTAHARFQPGFRRYVDELGLVDLYLVEPDGETIVYSVEKHTDLGTSLSSGPYSGSLLANTVSDVLEGAPRSISDLGKYDGAPGSVVSAYATPILDGDELVGVLAVLTDGAALTDLVTNGGDWAGAGYDDTADQYVVGADGTLRTDPRAYLEDPRAFLDAAEEAGNVTPSERRRIERLGTTVLNMRAKATDDTQSKAAERTALDGDQVVGNVTTVSSRDSDLVDELAWTVVTEIDLADAESALDDFRNVLVIGSAVFLIVAAFVAVGWANRTMAPVRSISDRLAEPDLLDEPLVIPEASPLEFHYLAASFSHMSATLRQQHRQLATAREERLELMREMLPPAIADRVAAGDLDELDEVAQTSVVVVVVLGLGELVQQGGHDGVRTVDLVHHELDTLAERHGLDRIKVVGDAYFASCGHGRPYIDHAPRAVGFATGARDAVASIARRTDSGLDTAIGVHTGPVTIGMVGEGRLIFDVWGETVSYAHLLARRAGAGQILVSEQTHEMLPDELVTDPSIDDDVGPVWSVPATTAGGVG